MSWKCAKCGVNEVSYEGGICEMCALGIDPYMEAQQNQQTGYQSGAKKSSRKMAPVKDKEEQQYVPGQGKRRGHILVRERQQDMTVQEQNTVYDGQDDPVQVYRPGQAPVYDPGEPAGQAAGQKNGRQSSGNAQPAKQSYITRGIIKNLATDQEQIPFVLKVFRCLFKGVPLTINNDITTFQVFPDYTGQSLNAQGNVCDQVAIYGKVNAGVVAENNEVEVYGSRSSKNVIVASKIKNVASGVLVTAYGAISPMVVWGLILAVSLLLLAAALAIGFEGIIWAVVIIICLMNLPLLLKLAALIFGIVFSFSRRN